MPTQLSPTLDDLRTNAETDLQGILAQLDDKHRAVLKAAIKKYGRVQDVPEIIWIEIQREIEDAQIAAIALLIIAADEWTTDEIARQGVTKRRRIDKNAATVKAFRQVTDTAAKTVDTLRSRLSRKIEDSKASGPGSVGELTDDGIDAALDDVLTPERRSTIATDQTTTAFSTGQRGAAERIGSGDIRNEQGQRVTLELIWETERDNLVCPRCAPLQGTTEDVWGKVFPDGPGPSTHPNCRCSLRAVIIVEPA